MFSVIYVASTGNDDNFAALITWLVPAKSGFAAARGAAVSLEVFILCFLSIFYCSIPTVTHCFIKK